MGVSKHILILLFSFFFLEVGAQTQSQLDSANKGRLDITQKGMYVLGGWAVANMAYSGYRLTNTECEQKYFHQFNVMWNTVNIALAAGSLLTNDFETLSLQKTLAEQHKMERILLLNIGLDIGYIATGFFLKEKGKTTTNKPERLRGYGKSLLLQGGFLLAFDGMFYYALQKHGGKTMDILSNVQIGFNHVGYRWNF